jgi:hypothetical protein
MLIYQIKYSFASTDHETRQAEGKLSTKTSAPLNGSSNKHKNHFSRYASQPSPVHDPPQFPPPHAAPNFVLSPRSPLHFLQFQQKICVDVMVIF